MEFDKSRLFTAANADELKVGSKVIVADSMFELAEKVEEGDDIQTLTEVADVQFSFRFVIDYKGDDGKVVYNLAYLVEEPEEQVLKWTDLNVGDVLYNRGSSIIAMVTTIHCVTTCEHIYLSSQGWVADEDLKKWELVVDGGENG